MERLRFCAVLRDIVFKKAGELLRFEKAPLLDVACYGLANAVGICGSSGVCELVNRLAATIVAKSYGRGFPQFLQNFPSFSVPHVHAQLCVCAIGGFGAPQLGQNLPVLVAPHVHVHDSGFGKPQLEQNLPVFRAPQEHSQPAAAAAAAAPPSR